MTLLLDTHATLWMTENAPFLGNSARQLIEKAARNDDLALSAFSFWEIAVLIAKKRLALRVSADTYRQRTLALGVREFTVTGDIGIAAVSLPELHGDPADRIIVATALAHDAMLVTADERLLAWKGPLQSHDART
jgi:PIN domain nuclease of toxin-antitoxin system